MELYDIRAFFAGWFGGIFVNTVCYPADTVKVNLQSSQIHPEREPHYKNSIDCAIKIYLGQTSEGGSGGLRAFYRGISSPMLAVGLSNAALFGVYGNVKAYFARRQVCPFTGTSTSTTDTNDEEKDVGLRGHLQNRLELPLLENIIAASSAAVIGASIKTPFEHVAIRMQTESLFEERNYNGALDCARQQFNQGGLRKLYCGLCATIIRDVPGAIAYFGCYGLTRQVLPQDPERLNIPSILFAGGVAGVAQWMLIFPLDTIKTHIQTARSGHYRDWPHAARWIYRHGGIAAFYIGISPALGRAFLQNACMFAGVEASSYGMRSLFDNS